MHDRERHAPAAMAQAQTLGGSAAGHSQLVLVDHPGRHKGDRQAVGQIEHRHRAGFPPARRGRENECRAAAAEAPGGTFAARRHTAGCALNATRPRPAARPVAAPASATPPSRGSLPVQLVAPRTRAAPMAAKAPMTPARGTPGASGELLRTPGSAGASPDASQLVERLQVLKSRLSTMTKTLEQSVAAASPLRGKANEEILYSTPKLVAQMLDGPIGQEASLVLAPGAPAPAGTTVTEVRFTLAASSEEEMEALVELLQLREAQEGAAREGPAVVSRSALRGRRLGAVRAGSCLTRPDVRWRAGRRWRRQDVRLRCLATDSHPSLRQKQHSVSSIRPAAACAAPRRSSVAAAFRLPTPTRAPPARRGKKRGCGNPGSAR